MKYLVLFFPFLIFSQQTPKADFTKASGSISIDFKEHRVSGHVSYDFVVNEVIDTIRIDAVNISFCSLYINDKMVEYKVTKKELLLFEGYKKGKNKVSFEYSATPKQTMYFTGIDEGKQIWTQGQGKYTSHWFPSFDDVNEKVIFNMEITYDSSYNVISNGVLKEKINDGNQTTWSYQMQKPMASYLLMVAIGKFLHQTETSKSGIPLENYYKPIDEDKYQYTYKDSKVIFDFLEKEIGVKYPWKIYRQIPVEDFLYGGMENTTSTLFTQDYVVDAIGFNDRNYLNVNAHELAHQWFGDMVTAKSGKHHWLQEGFATYYALLAERKVFGDDYFYYALYKNSQQLKQAAKTDTIPVMNEKASSLSFYQKGAWALHVIHEAIGEKKFQKAVKNYLKKYQFKNVETDYFLAEIKKVSNFDTDNFKKVWLEDYHYPANDINFLLTKNGFMRDFLKLQFVRNKPFEEKRLLLETILKSDGYFPLKKEAVFQLKEIPFDQKKELLHLAMQTNDVEVRQSVAETLNQIPFEFKSEYESLLDDASYDTKQTAFITLWKNFPESQARYLEKAKNWQGKNDKDLRITFLTLYQLYKEADLDKKTTYWDELLDYTSPKYESSIRQNAIENALLIQPKNEIVLTNLINATTHHKWQFTKFAREKIRALIQNQEYLNLFENLLPKLSLEEQNQLKRLLVK